MDFSYWPYTNSSFKPKQQLLSCIFLQYGQNGCIALLQTIATKPLHKDGLEAAIKLSGFTSYSIARLHKMCPFCWEDKLAA